MKKVKKLSYAALKRQVQSQVDSADHYCRLYNEQLDECAKLRAQLKERVDTTMIQERIRLASSIGQMMDTVCQTVKYVIGKEVM